MPLESSIRDQCEVHYYRGLDRLAHGQAAVAVTDFRTAIQIDPSFLDARHGLIRALQDAGNCDEAIEAARELIARNPEDPLAHTSLSILYQRVGLVPEAEAEALKAKLLGWKLELRSAASNSEEE